MKLQLILGFVLLSMLIIPAFAEDSNIIFMTDKPIYHINDLITISGSIETLEEYLQSVTIMVVSPDGNIVIIAQVFPESDGNFSHTLQAGDAMNISGIYEVKAQYGADKHTITFEFINEEEFQISVQISTDKSTYNLHEIITVTGTMIPFDDSKDGTITWDIYDDTDTIILTNTDNITNDGTFTFTIPVTELTTAGLYDIIVTIQGESSNRITFEFTNTANMEKEVLYSMIVDNTTTINSNDSRLTDHFDIILNSTNRLNEHQSIIDNLHLQLISFEEHHIMLNATLGQDFPAKFDEKSLNRINGDITRVQKNVDRADDMISDYLIQLEQAQGNNDRDLIDTLESSIGSQILIKITNEPILDVYAGIFELYPQNERHIIIN